MRKLTEFQKKAISKTFKKASVVIQFVELLGDENVEFSTDVFSAVAYIQDKYGWRC